MQKIILAITINASKEKVWETMLGQDTYKEWTKVFNGSSRFEGDWSEGSKILFIGTDENGKEGGMVSRIAKNIPYEYLSIEHLGILKDGVEDTTSEEAKKWSPSYENYSFKETSFGTEVTVEQDIEEQYAVGFEGMWKQALEDLKKLVEG